jgi:hypothetical protein
MVIYRQARAATSLKLADAIEQTAPDMLAFVDANAATTIPIHDRAH